MQNACRDASRAQSLDGRKRIFSPLRVSLKEGHFDGVFVVSTFQDMEWYWGLFNMAIFVGRAIENGIFVDTSFADCRIV